MKFKSLLLLTLTALLTLAAPRPARALEVSFDFFHDSLSPHGDWIEVGDYGYCWRPAGVDTDWAPYSDGYWAYTDGGWTWVSYEDYGGIVYHYGRWVKVEDEGWCWVPGYEWAPAWVSWRKNDRHVGWAPLPPEAHWRRERGISVWADTSYDIGPESYNFCRYEDFGAPVLRPVIIRHSENFVLINNTVNITNITYNSNAGVIFNGGLGYAFVNQYARRPIPALKLVQNNNYTVVNNHIVNNNVRVTNINSVQRGNQLTIIAPTVVRPEAGQVAALLKPKVTKVIAQQKVTHGWAGESAEQQTALRAKFQQEAAGKTADTTSATPLRAADLKVVPVKADPKAKLPTVNRNAVLLPPVKEDKKAPEAIANVPGATPPAVTIPGKIAGGKKPGKNAPPMPVDPPAVTGNPLVKEDKKTPEPIANVPVVTPAATPRGPTAPEKIAREKIPGKKPGKNATPMPVDAQEITGNPPPPKARELPVKPGIVKPFNPQGENNAATTDVRKATPPSPPTESVIEKRNAAAEAAAQKKAALQAAARTRVEQTQQQETARRNKAQEAAATRQRMQEQQQVQQSQQEKPVARTRTVDPQQMQQQQQQQQMLRERAAQAGESRQRNAEAQQSQAAAARQQAMERAQAQAAARQRAATAPQVQPQRNVPPAVQRNAPPSAPQQRAPAKGKKPLTPEEAAQQQQQLR